MAILLGLRLQDRKDQLLLAHVGRPFDIEILADQREVADLFFFECLEVKPVVFYCLGFGHSSSSTDHNLYLSFQTEGLDALSQTTNNMPETRCVTDARSCT